MLPRTIHFSYAGDSCTRKLTFLPQLLRSSGDHYELAAGDIVSIGNVPLFGRSICATPLAVPEVGTHGSRLSIGGIAFPALYVTIDTPDAPSVALDAIRQPVAAARPLSLPLSEHDAVFDYLLASEARSVACEAADTAVQCDIAKLELEQGATQPLRLERRFADEKVATIFDGTVEVLPAVQVIDSSVKEGQTVYTKQQPVTVTVDKPLKSATATLERHDGEARVLHEVAVTTEGATVTITPEGDEDLPREATYTMTLTEVEAEDGSMLAGPHQITFMVSGGPKVASVSVGTTGIDPSARIVLTLDQARKEDQSITDLVQVKGVAATVSASKDTLVVALAEGSRCADFSITIAKGLLSEHEIASVEPWTWSGRTRCHTIETVGYSAGGRAINAYIYGNGTTTYLYTAGIHGNELSSVYTIQSWMNDLEANPGKIPAGARVVVIPRVSPDGIARAGRDNNNGVNLNRNFPTRNWTSNIITGSGEQAGAGGASAGSEPETKALMNATYRYGPRFVITYHSSGYLVNSNDVGISIAAGQAYARAARYNFVPNSATTGTFGFEMTGTYEDWLLERGTPAILIELDTNTGNHYTRNSAAMWAMLGY